MSAGDRFGAVFGAGRGRPDVLVPKVFGIPVDRFHTVVIDALPAEPANAAPAPANADGGCVVMYGKPGHGRTSLPDMTGATVSVEWLTNGSKAPPQVLTFVPAAPPL